MRKHNICVLVWVVFLTVCAVAQDKLKPLEIAIQNEILRLEELGRQKNLRGDTNWDDLMAGGAYITSFTGAVSQYKKGQTTPARPVKSFDLTDLIVRVYGDTAIVTGLANLSSETPDRKPLSFQMRYLNVWRKSKDGWKITVTQTTTVRPPATP